MQAELEFRSLLAEQLGGRRHRSGRLKRQVEVTPGEKVRDLFSRLAADDPKFAELVFDLEGQCLRETIVVALNDRLLDLVGGLKAALTEGDRLTVVAALQGGAL